MVTWFNKLKAASTARAQTAVNRMEEGDFGDHRSVGEGVMERRIDFGPGCRVDNGREGDTLVILLGVDRSHGSRAMLPAPKRPGTRANKRRRRQDHQHANPCSRDSARPGQTRPGVRAALLGEALVSIVENDSTTAKKPIRDHVLAAMGFGRVVELVGKRPESLMRMLSEKGNPTIKNTAAEC